VAATVALAKPGIVHEAAVNQVSQWSDGIDRFIQWQSENILHTTPSPKQQEGHREALKWLLRLTKVIHSVASDPEFPDRSLALQLEAQKRQLEESWELFYNQPSPAEAEKILSEAFPHGS